LNFFNLIQNRWYVPLYFFKFNLSLSLNRFIWFYPNLFLAFWDHFMSEFLNQGSIWSQINFIFIYDLNKKYKNYMIFKRLAPKSYFKTKITKKKRSFALLSVNRFINILTALKKWLTRAKFLSCSFRPQDISNLQNTKNLYSS
jgi:hypothetical protein